MMIPERVSRLSLSAMLLVIIIVAPASVVLADEALHPCGIFTRQDAEELFKEPVSEGKARETSLPAGIACRYTFNRGENVYGLTVRLSTSAAIAEEGIHDSAKDVYERQVKARKSNEEASKKLKEIEGLGEGSFWEGTNLWTLRGDLLVIITVNSFLEGSFAGMDEMNAAQEDQDLALSIEVTGTVLERL